MKVLSSMDIEVLLQNNSVLEAAMLDDTPKHVRKLSNPLNFYCIIIKILAITICRFIGKRKSS